MAAVIATELQLHIVRVYGLCRRVLVHSHSSEALVAQVLVEAKGSSVPQPDDGIPTDLVSSPQHHLYNLLKGPEASYCIDATYLLPVACIVGFRFVLLRAANQSSIGEPL